MKEEEEEGKNNLDSKNETTFEVKQIIIFRIKRIFEIHYFPRIRDSIAGRMGERNEGERTIGERLETLSNSFPPFFPPFSRSLVQVNKRLPRDPNRKADATKPSEIAFPHTLFHAVSESFLIISPH